MLGINVAERPTPQKAKSAQPLPSAPEADPIAPATQVRDTSPVSAARREAERELEDIRLKRLRVERELEELRQNR